MPRITDPSFPLATTATLADKVLGVFGGEAENITLALLKSLVSTTVEDSLTSDSATNAVSVHQAKLLNDALANKLDTTAYVQHYRGKYASVLALETAIATGADGDYAIVDTGTGNDAVCYIWDAQEGWVSGGSISGSTTDDVTEGSTNLYFTSSRAISAVTETINAAVAASLEPTINTQTVASYAVGTVATDNDGKTILRMDNAAANTATITTAQTKPISIRQAGAGTTTLAAGSGVTLNGTLAFTAQHQTKTVIPLGSGIYDVVG